MTERAKRSHYLGPLAGSSSFLMPLAFFRTSNALLLPSNVLPFFRTIFRTFGPDFFPGRPDFIIFLENSEISSATLLWHVPTSYKKRQKCKLHIKKH